MRFDPLGLPGFKGRDIAGLAVSPWGGVSTGEKECHNDKVRESARGRGRREGNEGHEVEGETKTVRDSRRDSIDTMKCKRITQ